MTDRDNDQNTGWDEDGYRREKERIDKAREGGALYRFSLKQGTGTTVTILNDPPLLVDGHHFKYEGHFNHFEPSNRKLLNPNQPDLLTKLFEEPKRLRVMLCIDHTVGIGKKTGEEYKDTLKLLVVKHSDVADFLSLRNEECQGNLAGFTFKVRRSEREMSPAVGEKWSPVGTRRAMEELATVYPEQIKRAVALLTNNRAGLMAMFQAKTYDEVLDEYGHLLTKEERDKYNKFRSSPSTIVESSVSEDDEDTIPF